MADQLGTATCGCMCGAVRFSARLKNTEVGVCHCGMCQRWTGGAMFAVEIDGALEIEPEGQSHLGVFRSSDWGERGFCKTCGSSLFWRMQDGSHAVVAAPAIDDLADPKLTHEIFIDEKPDYYTFAEPTTKMTGAQVFAMFAPDPE